MSFQTDLFDSMIEDIYTLTNRPDLDGETAIALRTATTNAHLTDAYYRDNVVTQVQLPNSSNMVAIDIPTNFPNCRGFTQVRPLDVNMGIINLSPEQQIEVVELDDIYDAYYGTVRNMIAYASGDKLIVRAPIANSGFAVSYMQAPMTRRDLYNSWIAQMAPSIITFWASAIVLMTNGNEEKGKNYLNQVEKLYIPQLKSNFLLGAMR